MENIRIGKLLKNLRKYIGMSQADLARNICTQAQISKIENGNEIPSSLLLYQLSQRLGVDVNYFFSISETPRMDYINEVKAQILYLKRKRDYIGIYEIVSKEKKNPIFLYNKKNEQFILWHEGICIYYLKKNHEGALEKLNMAVSLTHQKNNYYYTETEIEILNSIAIIHKDLKQFDIATSHFKDALNSMKYLPQISDPLIKIKILYGLSKVLTDSGNYQESIKYCKLGLNSCLKLETFFLFGELNYQTGSNLIRDGQLDEGLKYIDKALQIFRLQNNDTYMALVTEQKENLINQFEENNRKR